MFFAVWQGIPRVFLLLRTVSLGSLPATPERPAHCIKVAASSIIYLQKNKKVAGISEFTFNVNTNKEVLNILPTLIYLLL